MTRHRPYIMLFLLLFCSTIQNAFSEPLKVGSKKFTENVILGEIVSQLLRSESIPVQYRRELGGTRVLWDGLLKGEIDVYPEYTGTITREILAGHFFPGKKALREYLDSLGIVMSMPLGFNDTYALGMKETLARKLNITSISDLRNHPDLRFGFTNEFMDRSDGWPGLQKAYRLPQKNVSGLDHDLAYRGIANGDIQVTDLYSTDADIRYYHLKVLKDDRHFFPEYNAVLLYRKAISKKWPEAVPVLQSLQGKISEKEMIRMNARVKIDRIPDRQVAANFVEHAFGIRAAVKTESMVSRILQRGAEHLYLVGVSLLAAILLAIPLGIVAAKFSRAGQIILGVVGIIQTIPSLALLVFMIPLLGIGAPPAILALFLYSLLPIVRNTFTGIHDIPNELRESARAIGLPPLARLRIVEMPMSARAILAGIKTSAVINVGTATLGALIGAGGFGQPILTGIRLDDMGLILQGAVPAAVLALLVQGFFDLSERFLVPKGLRLKPND